MISEVQWDKIKWNSRRGMRELDLMLEPFVEKHLPKMGEEMFYEYEYFLQCSDLELVRFLLRRQEPTDPRILAMVNVIIKCHEDDLS
ncbi:MAG: succinate dehydrogenase assembly factor 2 [Succinivibrionaceae bacterium]